LAELLYRLGKFAARRAWTVIVAWVAILGIAGGAFAIGFSSLTSNFDIPGTASGEVIAELEDELPDFAGASGTVVFHTEDGSAFTDEQQQAISDLVADADLPDVARVVDPFATEAQRAEQAQELADGRAQLDAGQEQLDTAKTQLDAGQEQLDAVIASGVPAAAVADQQAQIDAGLQQYEDGVEELTANRTTLDQGETLLGLAEDIRFVSEDGSAALVSIAFTETRLELPESSKEAVIEYFDGEPIDGVAVDFSTDIAQGVPEILGVGEIVGVIIAAIVLMVMLGTAIAAALPLVTAIFGVAVGALGALAFSGLVPMTSVTPVLGVMLGLAVGIDYALFIVNRHRKQLLQGAEVHESIGLANGTAGNAVLFAGSTVIIALLALNVTGVPFLGVMGTVAAASVLVAVLIAVTLTPALLGLIGMRALTRRSRAAMGHSHVAAKPVKAMSTLRAVITIVVAVAALLTIAVPSLSMRLGLPDGSSEPEDSTSHAAYVVSQEEFGEGTNATLLVTAQLPEGTTDDDIVATQVTVAQALADREHVVAVAPIAVSDDNTTAAFQVIPEEGPNAISTEELVRDLRTMGPVDGDIELGVAGQAAINIDISENLAAVLPLYLVVVVGLSLLIMILVFRSLLVPLIATGGFILSLFAAFGSIVAVFQWGWFGDVLAVTNPGPILSFLPVILTGILFGLAMDYQLFLASGMREAFAHGSPARLAVAEGFRAGRAVVTAAGLIMVSVFGGFIFSEATIIRAIGFGLAIGVLLDAFVVRMLIMPALMHLLGRSAWWIPKWLDRILPNVDVEGAALERRHHQ